MSFLSQLMSASKPIAVPIEWNSVVDTEHPIRQLFTHLRYWPKSISEPVEAEMRKRSASGNTGWLGSMYYWILTASLSTKDGQSPFESAWPEIYLTQRIIINRQRQEVYEAILAKAEAEGTTKPNPPELLDEDLPDEINFDIVGYYFQGAYDNPLGAAMFAPVFQQAMQLQGFAEAKEAADAKK